MRISKLKKITILSLIILLFGIFYFGIDSKLYYYGKNEFTFYKPLSFGIIPEYWGYDAGMLGFVLLDDGMTHIAKRNRYFTFPNIQIDSIISYGFNDSLVIALVNDTRKEKYFVISDGSKNIQLVPFSQFNVINIISKYNLNWIDNVNSPPSYLIMGRFFCGFLLFFSIICLIIYMVKMIKRKKGSVP